MGPSFAGEDRDEGCYDHGHGEIETTDECEVDAAGGRVDVVGEVVAEVVAEVDAVRLGVTTINGCCKACLELVEIPTVATIEVKALAQKHADIQTQP